MNLKPKGYGRRVFIQRQKPQPHYCALCGARISAKKKYCDKICQNEHMEILKRERRPAEVVCGACGKQIDPLSREPGDWKRSELHFCDSICVDLYRRSHDHYRQMSVAGNQSIRDYQEKHGHGYAYQERSKIISQNNTSAPPKAKHFQRRARVWGYEAHILPNAAMNGYIAHIPDCPDAGTVEASTAKEAVRLLRLRFTNARKEA